MLVFSEVKIACEAPRFFSHTASTSLSLSPRYPRGCPGSLTSRKMAPSTQDGLTSPLLEYEDFFRYTSGRWLWDEEQQLAIGTNASMSVSFKRSQPRAWAQTAARG